MQTTSHLAIYSLDYSRFNILRLYRVKLINLIGILWGAGVDNKYELLP